MRVRRTLAAAVATTGLLLAAGCGGDDGSSGTDDSGASTPDQPSDAGETTAVDEDPTTASEDEDDNTGTDGGDVAPEDLLADMKAAFDDVATVRMSFELGGPQTLTMKGVMAIGSGTPEMDLKISGATFGKGSRMVVVDGSAYISLPSIKGSYLKLDADDPQIASLTEDTSVNQTFAAFDAGLQKVVDAGEETINGQATEHYVFTVDTKKSFQAQGQELTPGLPKTIEYDVWLDEDDRMTRVAFDLLGVVGTLNMTDWGLPVHVKAPPASQVVEQ